MLCGITQLLTPAWPSTMDEEDGGPKEADHLLKTKWGWLVFQTKSTSQLKGFTWSPGMEVHVGRELGLC